MKQQTRAYNELVSLLLGPEDQQKFEWAVGAMLSDGPRNVVVFQGHAGTGKSTLMAIVRKLGMTGTGLTDFAPRMAFTNWSDGDLARSIGAIRPDFDDDTYVFVEANTEVPSGNKIIIHTTGDRVPVNKHYVLMQEIDKELLTIARGCSDMYFAIGEDYDITNLENNR